MVDTLPDDQAIPIDMFVEGHFKSFPIKDSNHVIIHLVSVNYL